MKFVIMASPRTGSSHLVNVLGAHPEIFCHGNVFTEHMMAVFWPKGGRPPAAQIDAIKAELRELRRSDPDAFLERIFSMHHGRAHVGFKIFRGQNDEILNKLTGDTSVRKIVLFRRNVLANYSSMMIAKNTQTWDTVSGAEAPQPPKIQFDERKFTVFHNDYIRYYRHVLSDLNKNRQDYRFLGYDEINEPTQMAMIVSYIGADCNQPTAPERMRKVQIRQNTSNVLDRFSNTKVVERFLAKNDRLHWLYEGETSIAAISRSEERDLETHDTMLS
jgi:LPS sulfotransferase NodH